MSAVPEDFLNRALLRQLAGEHLFASGEQCFALGRVRQVRAVGERVSAKVTGDLTYQVKLWRRRGKLCFRCDCETGRTEIFCKHCVAVGLAWLAHAGPSAAAPAANQKAEAARLARQTERQREQERARLATHLATLDPRRLAGLLLEATDYDEILRRRLLLETIGVVSERPRRGRTVAPPSPPDFPVYRRMLQEAVCPTGHVDYHAMPDYAQGIEEAIAPLRTLLRAGWSAEVIDLTELVLVELDAASDRVDTGDGLLNKVYDELQRLHLDACRAGSPDPAALAARLLHYELEGGLGIFNNAARTYAGILGRSGLAAWRGLLVREWQGTVQSTGADPAAIDHRRFQLQALIERVARDTGDSGALLVVKRADLRGVYDYASLAEALLDAGQIDEAIRTLERAAGKFTAPEETRVWQDFLVAAYERAGRIDHALELAWERYQTSGELADWWELKSLVQRLRPDDSARWRDRAREHLRGGIRGNSTAASGNAEVELLLEEGLPDLAWQAALRAGCRDDLWGRLAAWREAGHPQDAIVVHQRRIVRLLAAPFADARREIPPLLAKVRALFGRLGQPEAFEGYRSSLRSTHGRKRGFLRLLNAAAP